MRKISLGKRLIDVFLILLILLIIGVIFCQVDVSFKSPREVRDYIQEFGAYGPLMVIALITLEVVLAPIPGYVIAIGSGYVFGPFYGTLYSYLGNIIGTTIAFMLSRHFGRPLAKRLIKEDKLRYYERFFREKGVYGLWLSFIFPVFPADIISFVTGLSNIKFRKFFTIIAIAYLPNMLILNFFGDSILNYGLSLTTIILGAFLGLVFLVGFISILRG